MHELSPSRTCERATPRRRARGLTLIEVLVTVAVVVLVMLGVVVGSGAVTNARVRGAATMIAGAVKIAFTRASATSRPMRLVLDLDNSRVTLEESDDTVLVTKDEIAGGAAAATEAEKHAIEQADKIVKGPRAPRAQFRPVKAFGFDEGAESKGKDGESAKASRGSRSLGPGVRFRRVETVRSLDGQTEGRAYIYFWPGGQTERAAIQLQAGSSSSPEDGLTVLVSPLTGKTRIVAGAKSLEPPREDGTYSEREDTSF